MLNKEKSDFIESEHRARRLRKLKARLTLVFLGLTTAFALSACASETDNAREHTVRSGLNSSKVAAAAVTDVIINNSLPITDPIILHSEKEIEAKSSNPLLVDKSCENLDFSNDQIEPTEVVNEKEYIDSTKYVAMTSAEVAQVAEQYFNIKYADGSNVCGPLAAALMQDGGFLDPKLDVHKFWLLNDIKSGEIARFAQLKSFFPETEYNWFESSGSIADLNPATVKVGDLFYLKGGVPHWLTITKIDKQGRIYATTNIQKGYLNENYKDGEAWVIAQDVLMLDPSDDNSGQFKNWAFGLGNLHKTGHLGFLQITKK